MSKITNDSGDLKIKVTSSTEDVLASLVSAGIGVHTFYSTNNVINVPSTFSVRGIAHITTASPAFGWVICVDSNNTMYTNYVNNSIWSGWKKIISDQSTPWTNLTLQNSWVSFGSTLAVPSYRKNELGQLELRGTMKDGIVTVGTVLANLPAGFRPTSDRVFIVRSNNGSADVFGSVYLSAAGNLMIRAGSNNALSLDSIPPISLS